MSQSSLPVAVIVTAENCGHCKRMRGDGKLLSSNSIDKNRIQPGIPGGKYYDEVFVTNLITGNSKNDNFTAKYRVFNLHMANYQKPSDGVKSISFFALSDKPGVVTQKIFSKGEKDNTVVETLTVGSLKHISEEQKSDIEWSKTVGAYIPKDIIKYIVQYPTTLVFSAKSWDGAIRGENLLYGYVNGLKTKDVPPYGVSIISGKLESEEHLEILTFYQSYINGTKKLLDLPPTPAPALQVAKDNVITLPTSGQSCQDIGYILNPIL